VRDARPWPAARAPRQSIAELDRLLQELSEEERARFERLFLLDVSTGRAEPPASMHAWLEAHFGSVAVVRRQRVVKITNRHTLEGSFFNALRASRPVQEPPGSGDLCLEEAIRHSAGDPFCHPLEGTPADVFGRIRGKYAISASNAAKSDGWHGVIVFDEHNPLLFSAEQVADYVDTAQAWVARAHEADPSACYPFFLWNCLWRGGASILHGHAQVLLTRRMHLGRVESWRRAALQYRQMYGADYFADLIQVHRSLGLAIPHGAATILPSLTPVKEKETLVLAPHLDGDAKAAVYRVLKTFVSDLGVQSFNLALYQPPLAATPEDWEAFPFVFRILDRGRLESRASDLGALEILAQSVVTSDPYSVAAALYNRVPEEVT
jgi:galactose-1-phosphate uridylyltransferase